MDQHHENRGRDQIQDPRRCLHDTAVCFPKPLGTVSAVKLTQCDKVTKDKLKFKYK